MRIDIMTLFPDMCRAYLGASIIGRAREAGKVQIECTDIRDYTQDKHRRVDDSPYGGGMGMIMQAQPIYDCYMDLCKKTGARPHLIYLTPQGKTLTQQRVKELAKLDYIALLCALTAFYEKKVLHLPPAKPAALSPHQRKRLGLFIAAELASILLTVFLIVWLCPGHWAVVPAEQWGILLFRAVIDFGIGAGIAEEVLFRGTMRKAFQKNFGIRSSIVATSLVFGLLHTMNAASAGAACLTLLMTAALGALLCLIRLKTGTLLAPIVFHALWNIAFLGLVNTGAAQSPYTIATYVTQSPLCDWFPLLTIALLFFPVLKTGPEKNTARR